MRRATTIAVATALLLGGLAAALAWFALPTCSSNEPRPPKPRMLVSRISQQ